MIQSELPKSWQPVPTEAAPDNPTKPKSRASLSKRQSSAAKKNTTRLTNAQRAAWAHAHFIIHHGTNTDAVKFLTHQQNVENTPAEALHKVRVMARRRVPTWEQAAAVLFSSSDSSDDSSGLSTRDPTLPQSPSESTPTKTTPTMTITPMKSDSEQPSNSGPPRLPTQVTRRFSARILKAKARKLAAKAGDATLATPPPTTSSTRRKPRRKGPVPKPSMRPKKVKIAPSKIPGAGMGLFLMEDAEKGECIARYSGDPLTKEECERRKHSQYRMQVHRNLFLDAENPKHFEGRYINDARNSKFKVNARFAANYIVNICSVTGYYWVRIYAADKIKAGDKILIDYGEDFWTHIIAATAAARQNSPNPDPATTTTSSQSLWAAPAPFPESSRTSMDSRRGTAPASLLEPQIDDSDTTKTPTSTMIWPPQVPTPSSPTLLGYINTTHTTDQTNTRHDIHFPLHLSPVKIDPYPNHNQYMNEHFSFNQMYELNDTLLLPTHLTNPNTQNNT